MKITKPQKVFRGRNSKRINAKCEVSVEKTEDQHIKCSVTSEIPDGATIDLYLFKNYSCIESTETILKNGKIIYDD